MTGSNPMEDKLKGACFLGCQKIHRARCRCQCHKGGDQCEQCCIAVGVDADLIHQHVEPLVGEWLRLWMERATKAEERLTRAEGLLKDAYLYVWSNDLRKQIDEWLSASREERGRL